MKTKGTVTVIKYGGSILSRPAARKTLLKAITRAARRSPVVLVHGGGPEVSAVFKKIGLAPKFVKGRRVTTNKTMEVVERVLSGEVNKELVGDLLRLNADAVGISGKDGRTVVAKRVPGLGRVGEPISVNTGVLQSLLKAGHLPVMSSVCCDSAGHSLNVNADEVASAVARALKAKHLVYLTDVPGVLDASGKRIPLIRTGQIAELIKKGVVQGGMIPKIRGAGKAVARGVGEVDIIDGRSGIDAAKGTRITR